MADTADRNWNSDRRLAELEADGIVAEVVFPNTIPPFFPSASLMAPAPTREEFEQRWAGPARPQPLAGRLLRRGAGRAGGRRADPAQRRGRGGTGDPPGQGGGPDRRRPAAGRPAGLGAARALLRVVRPDLGGLRGTRRAGQPPRRVRVAAAGGGAGGAGGVHGGDDLVLAPGAVAPDLRRRLPPPPGPQAGPHRAGLGLDPRRARHAGLLPRPPGGGGDEGGHGGVQVRGGPRRSPWARAPPRSGGTTASSARASCGRTRCRCGTGSASTRSCGAATTRTTRAPRRSPGRACGSRTRACRATRSRRWSGGNAARVYGFDLPFLDKIAARVGPTVAEIAEPLKEIPAEATSPAFALGGSVRVW